ncbi:hypothetical protein [Granulicella sp. dw_53]|uniref:hypothetical protein n=1 Tax=Granulicella sp. dw_53 TaxID=2719792 RepID=UPI001BD6DDC6|nr:hypothetical protein [Granulicella sp. dw_53]
MLLRRSSFMLPLLVFPLLIGCVPNKIYRPGPAAVETAPIVAGSTTPAHFKLGVIEFDDMGESWEKCTSLTDPSNCQLTRTLDLIHKEKESGHDVIVVVFTHGWKNNASPGNEEKKNLRDFKLLMEQLSSGEPTLLANMQKDAGQSSPPQKARSYIGVYMAWRGQSLAGDVVTTFWNRRDAAQRVGSSDFAEAIYRIMGATKENSPNSRIVVVGHSFGARALETALTNTFVSLLVPQPDSQGQTHPLELLSPADLILYVNSANDSFRTKQMIELMKRTNFRVERQDGVGGQYEGPLFLSVTSTGDSATGVAFPLGQSLSALRKSFRGVYGDAAPQSPSQKTFFTQTPGHIPYLRSHEVRPITLPCQSQAELFRFDVKGQCYELTPVERRWNDSPFWVVTVPPTIIRDHSDIFNPSFSTMIIDLLEHYRVLDSPKATTMVRTH